ncbi:hypothetical protein CJD35_02685 [Sphingobium xenophagum]|uniref:Uncharacterized protein n=1 Tax=Sphingobium xenophagum TaxID=121428 RepID=A0A249MQA4_SPHXE|nr:hypothetical protein [Sphingobium xenophagum]ASY43482.1 hypothetical protein CJD35_02685 [Sphingobium xenophagum]
MTEDDLKQLAERASYIAGIADTCVTDRQAAVGEAKRELHIAATWHLRRASTVGSIDNQIFAHGSAEQALGGLDLCPIAALGLKAAGSLAYPWLLDAAEANPIGTYVEHARTALARPGVRAFCVELGSYHRFQHKAAVYHEAVQKWQASSKADDPAAAWRRRPITAKQNYLITMISECLAVADRWFVPPFIQNRGEAHDWLRKAGGRPMFWRPPSKPVWMGGLD